MSVKPLLSALIFLNYGFCCYAQTVTADELFTQARTAAFEKKDYPAAIQLCRQALHLSPGYTDIQIFLGRIFFWNNQHDSAQMILHRVVQSHPENEAAALAAARVAYFSNQHMLALAYCDTGIRYHSQSKELLLQKSKILVQLKQYRQAVAIADTLLKMDPRYTAARSWADQIKDYTAINKIGLSYDHTFFEKQFADDWYLIALDYTRQTKVGSFTGRLNYGSRYGDEGLQFEIDGYPRLSKRFYAYINIGYSANMPVFPKFRIGFSLFSNLPNAFEADIGFRYLNFDNDTWVYTGSVGKYYSNWWFNLRAYITPDNHRISQSYSLSTRYYLSSAENYLALILGTGLSPDDRSQALQLNSNYKLQTRRIASSYNFTLKKLNLFALQASYARVEYLPHTKDNQFNFSVTYQRRF